MHSLWRDCVCSARGESAQIVWSVRCCGWQRERARSSESWSTDREGHRGIVQTARVRSGVSHTEGFTAEEVGRAGSWSTKCLEDTERGRWAVLQNTLRVTDLCMSVCVSLWVIKAHHKMALSFCLFVCLSPEMRTCRALAWLVQLAAMSSRSAAGPVRPVTDILMAVGAYHVGHSGHTDLLCICLKILTSSNRQSRLHISQFWSEKRILHSLAVSS